MGTKQSNCWFTLNELFAVKQGSNAVACASADVDTYAVTATDGGITCYAVFCAGKQRSAL